MDLNRDGDGNIIGCPNCGARGLRKDGFDYQGKDGSVRKQRYYCYTCKRKTLNPEIVEKSPFSPVDSEMEPDDVSIQYLIDVRKKKYSQKEVYKKSRKLINLDINIDGPIGIAHFGDPHIDDDGTDISQILMYTDLINKTEGLFGGNLGDIQNNWIGRLAHLYGQQSTSAKESWRLTEFFVNKVDWLYLIA